MRILETPRLDFDDVLLVPKRTTLESREEVNLVREFKFKYSKDQYRGIPIIVANMDHTGTIEMAKAVYPFTLSVALHKFYSKEELCGDAASLLPFQSVGIEDTDICYSRICMDVANGYTKKFADAVSRMRDTFPTITIMAGNVVTPDMVYELIQRGADIVKIGIGPGAACSTRRVAGVGYPQLSAIIECADAAHGVGAHVCSDGGVRYSGDVAKAFAAGADYVMCGSLFAGHDECSGEFRGMSSKEAMLEHYGEQATYRASEGFTVPVEHRGPVVNTVKELLGGLRSACTYVGAANLKDLSKCATFVQVNRQK